MLLAQIKANYSSDDDDVSLDEETQEDESESEDDEEVKQSNKDGSDDKGEYLFILKKTFLVHLLISTRDFWIYSLSVAEFDICYQSCD